jgi:predicted metal-dependent HD superfamily phosphohydrolase
MYTFSRDYTDFSQPSVNGCQDFIKNLTQLLVEFQCVDQKSAIVVANTLWERMNDSRLKYHTPIHVLSILQDFQNLSKLKPVSFGFAFSHLPYHLAIWFHDAVYVIGAKKGINEQASALFMESMLLPFFDLETIEETSHLIHVTAEFDNMNLGPKESLMMDLDILNFGWEPDKHEKASQCVAEEFGSIYSESDYQKGRVKFLTALRNRGRIFRTQSIFDQFETIALKNIDTALENLKLSL